MRLLTRWWVLLPLAILAAGGGYLAFGGYTDLEFKYLFKRIQHWKPAVWGGERSPKSGPFFFGKDGVQGLREMGDRGLPRVFEEYGKKGIAPDLKRRLLLVFWDMRPPEDRKESPAHKVIPLLREGLKDPDYRIQWDCLGYIHKRKDIPDRIPLIASKIGNLNPTDAFPERMKRRAIEILMEERGEPVVRALLDVARDTTRGMDARVTAVRMIGRLGMGGDPPGKPPETATHKVVPDLGKLLREVRDKPDTTLLRKNLVVAIMRIGIYDGIPPLMEVVAGSSEAGADGDPDVRILGVEGLKTIPDRTNTAVPALMKALEKDEDEKVRLSSVWALGVFQDPQSVPSLVKALEDKSPEIRWRSAYVLGRIGKDAAESVFPLSKRAREDAEMWVRLHSVYALHRIGDLGGVRALGDAATDKDFQIRKNAVLALGEIQGRKAVPDLLKAARDEQALIRRIAVCMLGLLEDPQAIPTLKDALQHDPDKNVRANAAWAMSLFKKKDVVPFLIEALSDSDPDPAVRREAFQSLHEIREMDTSWLDRAPWGYIAEDPPERRAEAIARIRNWWAEAQKSFRFAKTDPNRPELDNPDAVMPLFYFQDPELIPPLVALLEDTDPVMRHAAYRTLMSAIDPGSPGKERDLRALGFDPYGEERERRAAAQRWQAWFAANRQRLVYNAHPSIEYFLYKGEGRELIEDPLDEH